MLLLTLAISSFVLNPLSAALAPTTNGVMNVKMEAAPVPSTPESKAAAKAAYDANKVRVVLIFHD